MCRLLLTSVPYVLFVLSSHDEQAGVKLSSESLEKLALRFSAADPADGKERSVAKDDGGGEMTLIDYDKFVRWLSEGGCLDDAVLAKVQHHLKARLSK